MSYDVVTVSAAGLAELLNKMFEAYGEKKKRSYNDETDRYEVKEIPVEERFTSVALRPTDDGKFVAHLSDEVLRRFASDVSVEQQKAAFEAL